MRTTQAPYKMKVIQAPNGIVPQTFTKSIFLAGPTPRDDNAEDWRPEALRLLEKAGYDGVVFNPNPGVKPDYDDQVDWERDTMNMADIILFWVPREMKNMPALTTNFEFGKWVNSGKAVLGYPEDADKMRYLQLTADLEGVPTFKTLQETVDAAIEKIGRGAPRKGGERNIPIEVWEKPAFQEWIQAQKAAGNRLDGAEIVWRFRVGEKKDRLFLWAAHVDVYIGSEDRHKTDEIVIMRPHISAIVAYCWPSTRLSSSVLDNVEVAVVKEFRSPASVGDCFIREVPGGSSMKPGVDPRENGVHEFEEETGYPQNSIFILENILPFEEIFIGSNHKSYKHKYFLAYMNECKNQEEDDAVNLQKYQKTEVSKLAWKTFDECLKCIRPYNLEKKKILTNINNLLQQYKLYYST